MFKILEIMIAKWLLNEDTGKTVIESVYFEYMLSFSSDFKNMAKCCTKTATF